MLIGDRVSHNTQCDIFASKWVILAGWVAARKFFFRGSLAFYGIVLSYWLTEPAQSVRSVGYICLKEWEMFRFR